MEFFKRSNPDSKELDKKDIVYSKSVKAGKRIYYLDVKQSRNAEWYLAITESKRSLVDNGTGVTDVHFEKHKIFLYPEDMQHFAEALMEMIDFIRQNQPELFERCGRQTASFSAEELSVTDSQEDYKPLGLKMEDFD